MMELVLEYTYLIAYQVSTNTNCQNSIVNPLTVANLDRSECIVEFLLFSHYTHTSGFLIMRDRAKFAYG